ncbi:hypothetical protein IJI69_00400 [Candidatus Saccharibacteria bacterium]|nr:hypothetical protein [Candidatus Saccharibacteria bacterium]MBQ6127149.1 hypothetical protein [Candidatus Saccharibacteria bacterium]
MLTELCQELNNWFDWGDRHYGTYTIENGAIEPLSFLLDGQYYRIIGSVFSDGVHQYGSDEELKDETFTGSIWAMAIPAEVIALSSEIEAYIATDAAKPSPYQSESWGGYSYTKASGSSSSGGSASDWQNVFARKLNKWRRIA